MPGILDDNPNIVLVCKGKSLLNVVRVCCIHNVRRQRAEGAALLSSVRIAIDAGSIWIDWGTALD